MKTRYYVTGLILSLTILYAFKIDSTENNNVFSLGEDSSNCGEYGIVYPNLNDLDTFSLCRAAEEVELIKLWERMLPDSCYLNENNEMMYQPKTIPPADTAVIFRLMRQYNNELQKKKPNVVWGSNRKYPFSFHKEDGEVESYFIPLKDLKNICDSIAEKGKECNGFRIYLATQKIAYSNKDMTTHVIVGPAYYERGIDSVDYYLCNGTGGKYLLDLTYPCPKACPGNNIFENCQTLND